MSSTPEHSRALATRFPREYVPLRLRNAANRADPTKWRRTVPVWAQVVWGHFRVRGRCAARRRVRLHEPIGTNPGSQDISVTQTTRSKLYIRTMGRVRGRKYSGHISELQNFIHYV